jgi:hypothetical protein
MEAILRKYEPWERINDDEDDIYGNYSDGLCVKGDNDDYGDEQ